MKKLNLIRLLLLSCVLFSCQPKKEKKQPIIYNNYDKIPNYKFDDDELAKKDTTETADKKYNLDQKKRGKVAVEK